MRVITRSSPAFSSAKRTLSPALTLREQRRVLDREGHRHRRHVVRLQRAVRDGDLLRVGVHAAHLAGVVHLAGGRLRGRRHRVAWSCPAWAQAVAASSDTAATSRKCFIRILRVQEVGGLCQSLRQQRRTSPSRFACPHQHRSASMPLTRDLRRSRVERRFARPRPAAAPRAPEAEERRPAGGVSWRPRDYSSPMNQPGKSATSTAGTRHSTLADSASARSLDGRETASALMKAYWITRR